MKVNWRYFNRKDHKTEREKTCLETSATYPYSPGRAYFSFLLYSTFPMNNY